MLIKVEELRRVSGSFHRNKSKILVILRPQTSPILNEEVSQRHNVVFEGPGKWSTSVVIIYRDNKIHEV